MSDPQQIRDARWERISTLFEAVRSIPTDEREAFFEASCGDDLEIRSELQSLVAAHDGAAEFLDAFYADVVHPALTRADVPSPAASTAADSLPVGHRIRHFVVHERLGSGGTGVVYRGRDTMLARDVAIKFLAPGLSADPAARARLVREAQAASRLEDPHVCAIHAVETTSDGGICIVMAHCANGTLRDRLRGGRIPDGDLATIALHLARGLASAHRAGIVHGDIKPANVGFAEGDVARLLDFGVAAHAHDLAASTRGLSGTLPYLAPELWRGAPRSPRTDVWALGVTFFEMATGVRPFSGTDPGLLADAIQRGALPPLRRSDATPVPLEFERLTRSMLSVEPEARPVDGAAVLAILAGGAQPPERASHAVRESAVSAVPDVGAPRRFGRALVGSAALLALVAWVATSSPRDRVVTAPALEVARTSEPQSSIAVLPFAIRGGPEIAYLENGMVDLLTPAFDGTGLVRGIDPNTVIGARAGSRSVTLDSADAQALATRVRADRYVVGSVVSSGPSLTFRATLRRIDGREVGRAQATVADASDLAAGVDALVRQLIATELLAPGDTIAGIAAATTSSAKALRAYLDGERELRDARPAAAVADFASAVSLDSTFALAWYRLARAARWNEVDSLSAHAAQRAYLLAPSLPPRLQALVRAYHTLRFGSPASAERQFRQIVRDYPTDVEAWMLLGEVRFNSNPYFGRPLQQAASAFERVMALDPRNREVTVYLMDLAAQGDRIGQLDTLFRMYFSPNSAGEQPGIRAAYMALHSRRTGASVGSPSPLDAPELAQVALHRLSADPRDRGAARAYATLVASAPASRLDGLLALASLDVADGDWNAASGRFRDAAALDPDRTLESRALLALAPSVRVADDTLRQLRAGLVASSRPRRERGGALTPKEAADVNAYLAGLLSVRLGDSTGVASMRGALARDAATSRIASALARALGGHWHLQRGRPAAALAEFEESTADLPALIRARHPALDQHLERLGRARALQLLGREPDARAWFRSLKEGFGPAGLPFQAVADSAVADSAVKGAPAGAGSRVSR
ncbi:MAG: protein kinase [Gemmatimonadaceae bacterium]|nr:protein kinase [Gemmatimonadaceae bacterium]